MIDYTILLAAEAVAKEGGGMFDFNATLPLMAIQFVALAALLNALFYKPVGKMIDDRDEYIRSNSLGAEARLAEAQKLTQQFEADLADTRRQAQAVIAAAKADAQKIASAKIAEAQQLAQAEREKASKEIEQQKQSAFSSLEQEVDSLSHQILTKLLGAELAR